MVSLTYAADEMTAVVPQSVRGDLLKIEGEYYTADDTAGHEVSVHVDKTTKLDGPSRLVTRSKFK
jgi:hypothetical protein